MKKKSIFNSLIFIVAVSFYLSCKKNATCENCTGNNPPIAVAGADIIINLPVNTIKLDGSASSDPDGTISNYEWSKISGNNSCVIVSNIAKVTNVGNLNEGIYQFELKVTDNTGLSDKDTIQVIVKDPSQPNRPPVANAGPDQNVFLPANAIMLNGSGSTDPEYNIVLYSWTKITGPAAAVISNPLLIQTAVTIIQPATYTFELKVTDGGGLFSKDTVEVRVNPPVSSPCDISNRNLINAQLEPAGFLSVAREGIAVASAANKILYAGGYTGNNSTGWQYFSRVDIFDINNNSWATAELTEARSFITAVTSGNKIFFAGGSKNGTYSSRVDIYDAVSNTWSIAQLSLPRTQMAGAAAGNKVVFAGGISGFFDYSKRVDIYDISTNTWTTDNLQRNGDAVGMASTVIGNKIFFAGNASDVWAWDFGTISGEINIYDVVSNTWSFSSLNVGRGYLAGIAVGNKNYWAGGCYKQPLDPFSSQIEMRDINGAASFGCLFQPNAFFSAVQKNNKIIFFTSGVDWGSYWSGAQPVYNKFDIYDITTDSWAIGVLGQSMKDCSVISVNNTVYVAGGIVNGGISSTVFRLVF